MKEALDWCIERIAPGDFQWVPILLASLTMLPLSLCYLRFGVVVMLKASLSPTNLLRRDFDAGLPVPANLPTQLPTAVVSEAASIARDMAAKVTSVLAQVTQSPYVLVSVNVSKASIEVGGLATEPTHKQYSSLTIIVWLGVATQALILLAAATLACPKTPSWLKLPFKIVARAAVIANWLLWLMIFYIVLLLCSAAAKVNMNLVKTQVYWVNSLTFATFLVALATIQLYCAWHEHEGRRPDEPAKSALELES